VYDRYLRIAVAMVSAANGSANAEQVRGLGLTVGGRMPIKGSSAWVVVRAVLRASQPPTQLLKAGFVRSAIEATVVDYPQQQPSPVSAALGGVRWRQRFAEVFATSARIAASSRTLPSGSVADPIRPAVGALDDPFHLRRLGSLQRTR
jgi:hypothetical protein